MLKMVKNSEPPETLRGREVIEEAARSLRQMRLHANRGAFAEGKHVAVIVDPRWNEDNETIRVLITCYAFGHRRVDWEGLPIFVESQSENGVAWLCFLNRRGQAVVSNLPPGDYRLSTRLQPERVVPRVLEQQPEELAALAAQGEEVPRERRVWRGSKGSVVWTVEETEDGEVQVAFETEEECLAQHRIVFHLVEPDSRRVQHSGQLTLEPASTPGKWEGWCSLGSRAEVKGPYELVFDVLPPGEKE